MLYTQLLVEIKIIYIKFHNCNNLGKTDRDSDLSIE
jgi:hypothetical protein